MPRSLPRLPVFLLVCSAVCAQAGESPLSTCFEAGAFLPVGTWADHRYAPDVRQIGEGPLFGLDLEVRLAPWVALAARGDVAFNRTRQWEKYAAARGDVVDASVTTFQTALMLRGIFWSGHRYRAKVGLGCGFFLPSGEETFQGNAYRYDFLKKRLGLAVDAEFDHPLGQRLSLAFRGGTMFVPGGIEYADGFERDVTTVALTLGLRFRPG